MIDFSQMLIAAGFAVLDTPIYTPKAQWEVVQITQDQLFNGRYDLQDFNKVNAFDNRKSYWEEKGADNLPLYLVRDKDTLRIGAIVFEDQNGDYTVCMSHSNPPGLNISKSDIRAADGVGSIPIKNAPLARKVCICGGRDPVSLDLSGCSPEDRRPLQLSIAQGTPQIRLGENTKDIDMILFRSDHQGIVSLTPGAASASKMENRMIVLPTHNSNITMLPLGKTISDKPYTLSAIVEDPAGKAPRQEVILYENDKRVPDADGRLHEAAKVVNQAAAAAAAAKGAKAGPGR